MFKLWPPDVLKDTESFWFNRYTRLVDSIYQGSLNLLVYFSFASDSDAFVHATTIIHNWNVYDYFQWADTQIFIMLGVEVLFICSLYISSVRSLQLKLGAYSVFPTVYLKQGGPPGLSWTN